MNRPLTNDYIRGLIDGEGCFTFHPATDSTTRKIRKVPTFSLAMSARDKDLITLIRDRLGLKNKIYEYKPRFRKDGYKRQRMIVLLVRDLGQLKNIIIPFFYKQLIGYKATQFENWINDIGKDSQVSEHFKLIYKLYKSGYYDKQNFAKSSLFINQQSKF